MANSLSRRIPRQAGLALAGFSLLAIGTLAVSAMSTPDEAQAVQEVRELASELHEARNVIDEHLGFGRDSR